MAAGELTALLLDKGEGAKFKGRAVTVPERRPVGVTEVEGDCGTLW